MSKNLRVDKLREQGAPAKSMGAFTQSGTYIDSNGNIYFRKSTAPTASNVNSGSADPGELRCRPYDCAALLAAETNITNYLQFYTSEPVLPWPSGAGYIFYNSSDGLVTGFDQATNAYDRWDIINEANWDPCSGPVTQVLELSQGGGNGIYLQNPTEEYGDSSIFIVAAPKTGVNFDGEWMQLQYRYQIERSGFAFFEPFATITIQLETNVGNTTYEATINFSTDGENVVVPSNVAVVEETFEPFYVEVETSPFIDSGDFKVTYDVKVFIGSETQTITRTKTLATTNIIAYIEDYDLFTPSVKNDYLRGSDRLISAIGNFATDTEYDAFNLALARNNANYQIPADCPNSQIIVEQKDYSNI